MNAREALPQYQCHKKVHALQISYVGVATLYVHGTFAPIEVGEKWISKYKPEAGGYYVLYDDGYTSFSPKEAFEDGYSLIGS